MRECAAVIAELIAVACGNQALNSAAGLIWRGVAAGDVSDDEAAFLTEAIRAKRPEGEPPHLKHVRSIVSRFPTRKPQRLPDRQRSLERRRRLAAAGPMPPVLAAQFTTGELAALKIVADKCRLSGFCDLELDAIAARGGISRSTVQNAIRRARFAGLLTVRERPQRGSKNLSNIVKIVSKDWLAWLAHRRSVGHHPIGFKKLNTTGTKGLERNESEMTGAPNQRCRVPPGPP